MVTRNFLVLFFVLLGVGCTPQCEKNEFEPAKPIARAIPEFKVEDLKTGEGPAIQAGDRLEVHYQEWLYDQEQSDKKGALILDTYKKGTPQKIDFGKDELIQGWQEGLNGMRQGGKRRLFIPSTMAYGDTGAGNLVPKGSHLVYEIELVSVVSGVSNTTK